MYLHGLTPGDMAGSMFGRPIGIAPDAADGYLRQIMGRSPGRETSGKIRDITKPPAEYSRAVAGQRPASRAAAAAAAAPPPAATKPKYDHRRVAHDIRWRRFEAGDKAAIPHAATAYHEAGHGLVARHYGLPVVRITLEGDAWGLTNYRRGTQCAPIMVAAVAVAGPLAESIFSGANTRGSKADEDAFWGNVTDKAEGVFVMARTRELLVRNWPAVTALARELTFRERMDGALVDTILRSVGFAL